MTKRRYRKYAYCAVCKKEYRFEYEYKRDMLAKKLPDPFYCPEHDPNKLHGNEKMEFLKSLVGIKFFDLGCFLHYGFNEETINTITRVTIQAEIVIDVSGERVIKKCEGLTMVWYTCRGKGEVWDGPENFRKLRPITDLDALAVQNKCAAEIERCRENWNIHAWIEKYTNLSRLIAESKDILVLGGTQ